MEKLNYTKLHEVNDSMFCYVPKTLCSLTLDHMCHVCALFHVGGRRFSEGTSADREIQRTLMEVTKTHLWYNT